MSNIVQNQSHMELTKHIKSAIKLFKSDQELFEIIYKQGFEHYNKETLGSLALIELIDSGLDQLLLGAGTIDKPIDDISVEGMYLLLRTLELKFIRLNSDYRNIDNGFVIDCFKLTSELGGETYIYHKIYMKNDK
jgi:hypothetical protein